MTVSDLRKIAQGRGVDPSFLFIVQRVSQTLVHAPTCPPVTCRCTRWIQRWMRLHGGKRRWTRKWRPDTRRWRAQYKTPCIASPNDRSIGGRNMAKLLCCGLWVSFQGRGEASAGQSQGRSQGASESLPSIMTVDVFKGV